MLSSSSFISDNENVTIQNSFPHFRIFSSSTFSWISFLSGPTSTPPSRRIFLSSVRISPSFCSPWKSCFIHSSSTDMTRENCISLQIFSAFSASSMQMSAPFSAPTEVPATAAIFTPASLSAFHAPIWYAPLAPPPSSTSPYSFVRSINGLIRFTSLKIMKPVCSLIDIALVNTRPLHISQYTLLCIKMQVFCINLHSLLHTDDSFQPYSSNPLLCSAFSPRASALCRAAQGQTYTSRLVCLSCTARRMAELLLHINIVTLKVSSV